jgi:hypothetical protein
MIQDFWQTRHAILNYPAYPVHFFVKVFPAVWSLVEQALAARQ